MGFSILVSNIFPGTGGIGRLPDKARLTERVKAITENWT